MSDFPEIFETMADQVLMAVNLDEPRLLAVIGAEIEVGLCLTGLGDFERALLEYLANQIDEIPTVVEPLRAAISARSHVLSIMASRGLFDTTAAPTGGSDLIVAQTSVESWTYCSGAAGRKTESQSLVVDYVPN